MSFALLWNGFLLIREAIGFFQIVKLGNLLEISLITVLCQYLTRLCAIGDFNSTSRRLRCFCNKFLHRFFEDLFFVLKGQHPGFIRIVIHRTSYVVGWILHRFLHETMSSGSRAIEICHFEVHFLFQSTIWLVFLCIIPNQMC